MSKQFKTEHTRKLPHFHRVGATFFITTHLHGSIPKDVLKKLQLKRDQQIRIIKQQNPPDKNRQIYLLHRAFFHKFDNLLDACQNSPTYLKIPEIAIIIEKEIRKHDGIFYNLVSYTLMPNHLHLVLDFSIQLKNNIPFNIENYTNLSKVMKLIKGASSFKANKILGNKGKPFWSISYHDRYIRDYHHYLGAVNYTINNVVKAKIAPHWRDHAYTWLNSNYQKLILIFPK